MRRLHPPLPALAPLPGLLPGVRPEGPEGATVMFGVKYCLRCGLLAQKCVCRQGYYGKGPRPAAKSLDKLSARLGLQLAVEASAGAVQG